MSGTASAPTRTNSITNNSGTGAVAGTPGTLPTGWSVNLLGASQEVVGTGTANGIDYLDIRFFGTPTSTNVLPLSFQGSSVITASVGQVWTESAFLAITAGDFTNVGSVILRINWQGNGSNSDSATLLGSLTSSMQRFSLTATAPASTTFAIPRIGFGVTISSAINFTLRIGRPALEQGPFPTVPARTTSAAVTRLKPSYRYGSGTR